MWQLKIWMKKNDRIVLLSRENKWENACNTAAINTKKSFNPLPVYAESRMARALTMCVGENLLCIAVLVLSSAGQDEHRELYIKSTPNQQYPQGYFASPSSIISTMPMLPSLPTPPSISSLETTLQSGHTTRRWLSPMSPTWFWQAPR